VLFRASFDVHIRKALEEIRGSDQLYLLGSGLGLDLLSTDQVGEDVLDTYFVFYHVLLEAIHDPS
jgi:hypothetical protein